MRIIENTDATLISGTFNEMEPLIKDLKSIGFKWTGSVWSIPVEKLTPKKKERLKALLDPVLAGEAANEAAMHEAWDKMDSALKNLYGYKFAITPSNSILVSGSPQSLNPEAKRAGGSWFSGVSGLPAGFLFGWKTTDPKLFKAFINDCIEDSNVRLKEHRAVLAAAKDKRIYPNLSVSVSLNGETLWVSGDGTRDIKDELKRLIQGLRWDHNGWSVHASNTTERGVLGLYAFLEKEEAQATARKEIEKAKQPANAAPAPSKRPNMKPGICTKCGDVVPPGEGWLYEEFEQPDHDNEMDFGRKYWAVVHKDQHLCEAISKDKQEKAHAKSVRQIVKRDAVRQLRDIFRKDGEWVPGDHRLQGRRIDIDKQNLYGGGEWLVIEPNEHFIWHVQNNGADGDDWSHNNVLTGGAGGIGRRMELTSEILGLIDIFTS